MSSSAASIAEQVNDLLDAVTPATGLDDDALRARLVECEQAVNMFQAVQAQVMVEMGPRAHAADQAEVAAAGTPLWSRECREQFVADEADLPAVQATGWTSRPAECGPGCSRPQSNVLSSTLNAP